MIGLRGWILVIGLLVFLAAEGEGFVKRGVTCCKEDWEKLFAPALNLYKDHAANLKAPAFITALEAWMAKTFKISSQELEDLCGGFIEYKCEEGPMNSTKCECNKDTQFVIHEGICRVPGELLGPCMGGQETNPCIQGTCAVAEGKHSGQCEFGGVDNSIRKKKMMRMMEKTGGTDQPMRTRGPGRTPLPFPLGLGKNSAASNIQRPIMWVIIGGLALIPPASS